jgi:endogenous inhibitor of DNA gyrase (YacG/DUF329 family)
MVGKCLICKKERDTLEENEYYPFCSLKCKQIDLYKWLNEGYSLDDIEEPPLIAEPIIGED